MTRASLFLDMGNKDVKHQNNAYRKGLDLGIWAWDIGNMGVALFALGSDLFYQELFTTEIFTTETFTIIFYLA